MLAYVLLTLNGLSSALLLVSAYAFQEASAAPSSAYRAMFKQLDDVRSALANLEAFFAREEPRARKAAEQISELRAEEATLKPVVSALRKDIEAFERSRRRRWTSEWKNWLIAFVIGLLASLLANSIRFPFGAGP